MTAYYNELDPFAAQWLRQLIQAGVIAPGFVDERDIRDVKPNDFAGFTQCHFFAGVGVWSYALRQAGWSDDTPVWTGSCPCQPFSAAGRGAGVADERHLWPHFHYLISQCNPGVVFGEQVASKDGLAWLDLVQTDLEAADYAFGAVDLCAAGVGSPNIRQRDWFVAERLDQSTGGGCEGIREKPEYGESLQTNESESIGVGNSDGKHSRRDSRTSDSAESIGGLRENSDGASASSPIDLPGPTNGLWRDADWLFCRDGKWRPVKPGAFPLANGAPARVVRLRGYGNAINAEAATTFIEAYLG